MGLVMGKVPNNDADRKCNEKRIQQECISALLLSRYDREYEFLKLGTCGPIKMGKRTGKRCCSVGIGPNSGNSA